MKPRVAIIGAGVAGMAAAVACLEQGCQVFLIEKNRTPGGRTRSFALPGSPFTVDSGQHLLLAGYTHTRTLLEKLGTAGKVHYQPGLRVHFLLPDQQLWQLKALSLPPPFHLMLPLMLGRGLSLGSRARLLGLASWLSGKKAPLERELTVSQWLHRAGQTPQLAQWVWKPITLSALNTPPGDASAALFLNVLREGLLKSCRASGLGFPRVMLSDLLVHPFLRFARQRGATLLLNSRAVRLTSCEQGACTVALRNGHRLSADAVVVALPPREAAALLEERLPGLATLARTATSPIVTVNVWLNRPLNVPLPLALVEGPFHWLLPLPRDSAPEGLFGYSLVSSAAFQLAERPAEQLEAHLIQLLRRLPAEHISPADIAGIRVVKERRATLLQSPAFVRLRPGAATPLPGVFLAGDWTQTGLPQTIESAAISGLQAALALQRYLQSRPAGQPDYPREEPAGLSTTPLSTS
ncbi:MAG: FAD-dependent oxidoreductase [Calditrichaeota bacterium]|nr:MAG: FAD-dependent oxidoreductase [Calditrichota bacterium]